MTRPGIEPGPPRWEANTLEKSSSKQLGNSDSEHLHMSARPVENACDKLILSIFLLNWDESGI
jgi:hypothetical protein